MIEFEKKI